MAITVGNKTVVNQTPGGNQTTISNHTQNSGSDRLMVVLIGQNNGQNVNSVTWDGVTMTQIHTRDFTSISTRYTAYYLLNPTAGGTPNVVVNYSAAVWNPVVICVQSFTGASGIGNEGTNGLANSVHTQSLTISAGSVIMGAGISSYTISGITIDGTLTQSPNFDFDGSVNGKRFTGEFSSPISTAGSKNISIDTGASSFTVGNLRFEVQEAGGTPPTTQNSNFLTFFH